MVKRKQSAGDRAASSSATQTGTKSGSAEASGLPAVSAPAALPLRAGDIPIRTLVDLYMRDYAGRDGSRVQRLSWWCHKLGDISLENLSDNHVHAALEELASQPSRCFMGRDVDGRAIYKAKGHAIAPATVNRYAAALASVLTWAAKRRIAPRGFVHPCRTVERRPENNEKTRFLSEAERQQLLQACRNSAWPRLYLLVLLALTTGARKGELLAISWQNIDMDRALAFCGRTKNGDPKTLPLVPAVVEELRKLRPSMTGLVFASKASTTRPYAFEGRWKSALKVAKVRNFRFHDLRHTCASMLAQNGATLLEIGDVLGHRQLQMTKRYSHLTTGHKAALVNRVLGELR